MTPSQKIFEEIKQAAIKIWNTYDDKYGYVTEKLDRINSVNNFEDNVMVFYRMFDFSNKKLMRKFLSQEALDYIDTQE